MAAHLITRLAAAGASGVEWLIVIAASAAVWFELVPASAEFG